MLNVQRVKFEQAIRVLDLLDAKYKIILPDGEEHGELKVAEQKKPNKRNLPSYGHLETRKFFTPFIKGMKAGDTVVIDCAQFDKRVIARDISSYICNSLGGGFVSVLADVAENYVEVFALKDLS
jgi:hypothetical protein